MSRLLFFLFFLVISCQVNLNEIQASNLSPIAKAILENNYAATKAVIDAAINSNNLVNAKMKYGLTPLMLATLKGNTDIAKLLIEKGADVNAFDGGAYSAMTSVQQKELHNIDYFLQYGKPEKGVNYDTCSVLMIAAFSGHLEIAKLLLANGADVNALSEFGYSALTSASKEHLEIVRLLLKNNADVNIVANTGINALMSASMSGNIEIMELLLKNGADINFQDRGTVTILSTAIYNNYVKAVEFLIKNGADIDIEMNSGETHLSLASRLGYVEIVKLLLKYNTNTGIKEKLNMKQALDSAKESGHSEVVKLLSDYTRRKKAEKSSGHNVAKGDGQMATRANKTPYSIPPNNVLIASMPKKPGIAIIANIRQDILGLSTFTADQKPDTCVHVRTLNSNPLKSVRLESMGSVIASWKTKGARNTASGVLAVYHNNKLVNANDEAFSIDVSKGDPLLLCFQDNGAFKNKKGRFRVIFYYQNGTRSYSLIQH